ncbi:zinc-binding dehydrogenase [Streptomyces sp. NPDC051445]|uniref:zinc-binding dehydrogenase n=1 Tax=Streptomyces sp. NPDC051445 TaxID=3365653 RepID=UPI00379338C2
MSPRAVRGRRTVAIQPAKHLGASVATTVSATKTDLEKNLGADLVIDYQKQAFETALHDYDVVIDTVGGETLDKSLRALKPDGTVISVIGSSDPTFARSPPDTSAPYAPGCATWPPRPVPRTSTRSPETPGVARIPTSTAAQKTAVAITDSPNLILCS